MFPALMQGVGRVRSNMESKRIQSWIYKCLTEEKSGLPHNKLSEEDMADFTHEFLLDIRSVFEHFVKAFNDLKNNNVEGFSEPAAPSLKLAKEKLKGSLLLYDLANKEGFMLFRRGYRLIFSFVKPGRIHVQLLRQKPLGETETFVDSFINAVNNDTMSINWVDEDHQGFVNINILARYYMRCFLQGI